VNSRETPRVRTTRAAGVGRGVEEAALRRARRRCEGRGGTAKGEGRGGAARRVEGGDEAALEDAKKR